MFSKLPELLGRSFAIAYFLPMALFIVFSQGALSNFGQRDFLRDLNAQSELDALLGTTLTILIAWVGGIGLLAANRDFIRFWEGYGRVNPLRLLFQRSQEAEFSKLEAELRDLAEEYHLAESGETTLKRDFSHRYMHARMRAAERYPDQLAHVLPTSLGNTMRAYEVYSRVMYGFDVIPGWPRLLTVIPKDYQEHLTEAKAFLDLWINVAVLALVYIAEWMALAFMTERFAIRLAPVIALLVIIFAIWRARVAAELRGEYIKAAVDVYLPELYGKLGFFQKDSAQEESDVWTAFSQAILYRDPDVMPVRKYLEPAIEERADDAETETRR